MGLRTVLSVWHAVVQGEETSLNCQSKKKDKRDEEKAHGQYERTSTSYKNDRSNAAMKWETMKWFEERHLTKIHRTRSLLECQQHCYQGLGQGKAAAIRIAKCQKQAEAKRWMAEERPPWGTVLTRRVDQECQFGDEIRRTYSLDLWAGRQVCIKRVSEALWC